MSMRKKQPPIVTTVEFKPGISDADLQKNIRAIELMYGKVLDRWFDYATGVNTLKVRWNSQAHHDTFHLFTQAVNL